jgi:hypothetical protein
MVRDPHRIEAESFALPGYFDYAIQTRIASRRAIVWERNTDLHEA